MSTNRYIDKLKARLAKEADQRMQLQALLDDQVARNRALLAERDAMKRVLRDARDVIATALKAGAPDWFETEEDIATHTTIKKIDAALQGAQP